MGPLALGTWYMGVKFPKCADHIIRHTEPIYTLWKAYTLFGKHLTRIQRSRQVDIYSGLRPGGVADLIEQLSAKVDAAKDAESDFTGMCSSCMR